MTLHSFLLTKAASTTTKSNPYGTLIFIVIIAAIGYFLLIRPQRRRARVQHQTQSSIEVGNEIMLTSGIIGRVVSIEGDRARIEIAPGTEIVVVRAAIARQVPPPVSDDEIAARPDEDDSHLTDNQWWPAGHDGDDAAPDANDGSGGKQS
ncbi:MAG: preprotein translocase subunit YajC [Acidimicrobiales bacterium]